MGCPHLEDFCMRKGPHPFQGFSDAVTASPAAFRPCIRLPPQEVPACTTCAEVQGRLYACLSCAAVGCCGQEQAHALDHATACPDHPLAVDVDRMELYCALCNDQVYHKSFDRTVLSAVLTRRFGEGPSGRSTTQAHSRVTRKRKLDALMEYCPWSASAAEEQLLREWSKPVAGSGKEGPATLPQGLRGLNNLGNTCFMNCVLQALLHTPLLRNFFLADSHNPSACLRGREDGGGGQPCLACDMDTIFAAAFSGERRPYSPAHFLYSWWRHAENLAGYEQQDAHEFFISVVDAIHGSSSPLASFSHNGNAFVECRCIIHRVFGGQLCSKVTCAVCGFTSTTHDPCVDISLDLEPDLESLQDLGNGPGLSNGRTANAEGGTASAARGGGPARPSSCGPWGECYGEEGRAVEAAPFSDFCQSGGTATLTGCLEHFTRQERLGSSEKFLCQSCGVRQEAVKQMSVRRLPPVLCLHLKRFEHSSQWRTTRKLGLPVHFPLCLDMAPYLSSSVLRRCFEKRTGSEWHQGGTQPQHSASLGANGVLPVSSDPDSSGNEAKFASHPSCFYELFAVVSHAGQLEVGHYVTFLRLAGRWYKCDDAWVTSVDEEAVRSAQAYMLYYGRSTLAYRGGTSFSKEGMGGTDCAEASGVVPAGGDAATLSSSQVNGV